MPSQSSECQGSIRLHSFSVRAFPQICHGDIGIVTKFRKSFEKGSLEFSFSENTIRHCKDFDFPEATLKLSSASTDDSSVRDGVMKKDASVVFDFGSMSIREACLEVEKAFGGEGSSLLRVQASWSPTTNAFALNEEFRVDSKNSISGSYDFSTDEAIFGYERTLSSSWSASAQYNVQSSCGEYKLDRSFKADEDTREGALSMVYIPKKDIARVSYDQEQWHWSVGMNTGSWVAGFLPIPSVDSMHVKYTHLFTL